MTHDPTDPTRAEEFAPIPTWPKTIGIISICYAIIMSGCAGCGLVQNVAGGPKQGLAAAIQLTTLDLVSQGAGIANTLLLLVAGILLLIRKNAGKALHILYAVFSFPLLAIGAYLQLTHFNEVQQWLRDNPTSQEAKAGGFVTASMIGIFAVIVLIVTGYSLFLLAWMVSKRKADLGGTTMSEIV